MLSIVSPVFCAEAILPSLVSQIKNAMAVLGEPFEIILVEDGGPDRSWQQIVSICASETTVRGVRLTRNFGQQNAITAGLTLARGDRVVVIDCDLQDDPRYIVDLVATAREGFDVVFTKRRIRNYGRLRNGITRIFYSMLRLNGDLKDVESQTSGYALISRRVVDAYLRMTDYRRDFLMLVTWMGFRHKVIEVEHMPRFSGRSSYSWAKLVRHGVDTITSHSKLLLNATVALGFVYVFTAFFAAAYLIASYYVHGYQAGWASTMVVILGASGFILLAIGVLGIYIGNIFDQVRGRPMFLVQEVTGYSGSESRSQESDNLKS